MPKSSTLRLRDDLPESERSGIHATVVSLEQRATAKVPRVDLERLLAAERVQAEADEVDATIMCFPAPARILPGVVERTLAMPAPRISGVPSPLGNELGDELPPEMPELTALLKFTPVPIPAAPPVRSFEAMRAARIDARRTKILVVGIWAFALTLASSLGYVIASHG